MDNIYNTSYSFSIEYNGFGKANFEFAGDVNDLGELTHSLIDNKLSDMFPGKVIVKCKHCGQWGARKTECIKCGAPID